MKGRPLPEIIHYGYSQNNKKWKAWDIIFCKDGLSILTGTPKGCSQTTYYDDEAKEIVEFLERLGVK